MKLSIITTVYQAEKDLPRLLDSMMAQKSSELEFFLIDNGSTDRSNEICKEYSQRDKRFKILRLEENIGYIGARNKGLDVVKADYIGFSDSDDYLETGGYDKAIEEIKKENCDLYIARWNVISGNQKTTKNISIEPGIYEEESLKDAETQFFGTINEKPMVLAFMWKQIISQKIIKDIRFEEQYRPCDDIIFNARIIQNTNKLYVSKNILYNYIINSSSITAKIYKSYNFASEYERLIKIRNKLCEINNKYDHIKAANAHTLDWILASIYNLTKSYSIHSSLNEIKKTIKDNDINKLLSDYKSNSITKIISANLLKNEQYLILITIYKVVNKLKK